MIVGNGDYRYQADADRAKLPDGRSFEEASGTAAVNRDIQGGGNASGLV